MLYSASQLIGKTMILDKPCNVYRVIDVNNYGDKALPAFVAPKDYQFVVDSFLGSTAGYTSDYGITYAARTTPYFTFFDGGIYYAIAVIGDGRFSLAALREQGALSVKEEVERDLRESKSDLANFFDDISKPIKLLMFAGVGYLIFNAIKKNQ